MRIIVLAGGKGRRLGLIGQLVHKAVLPVNDVPLIIHQMDRFLELPSIDEIVVLTGHRGNDIRQILKATYSGLLKEGGIKIVDFPDVSGTLSRLVAFLARECATMDMIVTGLDSIIPGKVLYKFVSSVCGKQKHTTLLLSPRLSVAPTHGRVFTIDDVLYKYSTAHATIKKTGWYCDVGFRYFSAKDVDELRETNIVDGSYLPDFFKRCVDRGNLRGYFFHEPWRHYATVEDFIRSEPIPP